MTRPPATRRAALDSSAGTRGRSGRTNPARNHMLAKLTREARERLGPDATDRQVARAARAAHKAFYARLSAAGVAARTAALSEALAGQRRSAWAFAHQGLGSPPTPADPGPGAPSRRDEAAGTG